MSMSVMSWCVSCLGSIADGLSVLCCCALVPCVRRLRVPPVVVACSGPLQGGHLLLQPRNRHIVRPVDLAVARSPCLNQPKEIDPEHPREEEQAADDSGAH